MKGTSPMCSMESKKSCSTKKNYWRRAVRMSNHFSRRNRMLLLGHLLEKFGSLTKQSRPSRNLKSSTEIILTIRRYLNWLNRKIRAFLSIAQKGKQIFKVIQGRSQEFQQAILVKSPNLWSRRSLRCCSSLWRRPSTKARILNLRKTNSKHPTSHQRWIWIPQMNHNCRSSMPRRATERSLNCHPHRTRCSTRDTWRSWMALRANRSPVTTSLRAWSAHLTQIWGESFITQNETWRRLRQWGRRLKGQLVTNQLHWQWRQKWATILVKSLAASSLNMRRW